MSRLRDRFEGPPAPDMQEFSSSIDVDLRMVDEDIDGSLAHAAMLGEVGVISAEDAASLEEGLQRIRSELHAGEWRPGREHDDLHMAVESRLAELVGETAKKLHTARSRNDQVATDVRLWLKRRLLKLDAALVGLLSTLLDRAAGDDGRTLIPGYTHLQRGQPIPLAHNLLAHAWALSRDRERLGDALRRLDRSPLGGCAMAGTPHPIRRERTAELLDFAGVVENAMDAVAARDHEQEVAAACAICMTHLSRMAEELVLWSSSEFSLVTIDERYATGSSIMPQKRNPDAAELVRAKAARAHGALLTLLGVARGLAMAYNRDLQETRGPLFDAVETTIESVRIVAGMWNGLTVQRNRFAEELAGDFSLSTDIADLLVERGVPFRQAHGTVARIVRWCEQRGGDLRVLTAEAAAEFHPALADALDGLLDPQASVERRTSRGGTARAEIERQIEMLRGTLP